MSSNTISLLNGSVPRIPEVRGSARLPEFESLQPAKKDEEGKELPPLGQQHSDTQQQLQSAVSELNDFVQNIRRNLEFTIDDESGRIVIKVIDSESKEIIRQIPPEEAVQLAQALEGTRDGTILNAKA